MRRKSVTVFVPFFPPIVGGMERQAWILSKIFQGAGYDVLVVTTHSEARFSPRYTHEGIAVAHHRATPGISGWARQFIHVLVWAWRRRHSAAFVVIQPKPNYMILYGIAECFNIPRLALFVSSGQTTHTGDEITILRSFFAGSIAERLLKSRTTAVVSSDTMRAKLLEYGFARERIEVIRIPVETDVRLAKPKPLPKTYWYLGRLEENKGLHILIDAWKSFVGTRADRRDRKLVLMGRPVNPYWSSLLQSHGDLSRFGIDVAGEVPSPWEHPLPDVLVHPTLLEGMSSTLLEAMSRGIPILTTSIPVNVDLFENGRTATLVEPNSVSSFAQGLEDVENDFQSCLDKAGLARERIVREHGFESVSARWSALFGN